MRQKNSNSLISRYYWHILTLLCSTKEEAKELYKMVTTSSLFKKPDENRTDAILSKVPFNTLFQSIYQVSTQTVHHIMIDNRNMTLIDTSTIPHQKTELLIDENKRTDNLYLNKLLFSLICSNINPTNAYKRLHILTELLTK